MGLVLIVLTLAALLAIVGTGLYCYRMGYRQAELNLEIQHREMEHLQELDRLRQLLIRQHGATEWERRFAEGMVDERERRDPIDASRRQADDRGSGGGAAAGDPRRDDDRGKRANHRDSLET